MITAAQARENFEKANKEKQDRFLKSSLEYLDSEEFQRELKLIENTSLVGDENSCVIKVRRENISLAKHVLTEAGFDCLLIGDENISVAW